jgi:hypothetical protein
MDFGISVAGTAAIDVKIMFLDCVIDRHSRAIQPPLSSLAKNIILASKESSGIHFRQLRHTGGCDYRLIKSLQ